MNINLTGRNALVCGSSQGIGKAVAISLSELGCNITLVARNEKALKISLSELSKSNIQKHEFLLLDFNDAQEVKVKINEHVNQSGITYHILINNTGGPPSGPIMDADENDFLNAFNNHLIINQILAQAVIPGMKKAKFGRIINIISTSVKAPIKGLGVSNTIRGAVASWAKSYANEVGSFGITVNNILPGFTKTNRLTSLISKRAEQSGQTIEKVASTMMANVPLGRFANPEEIAAGAAFLASPAASYISGTNLVIDGGRTACL